MTVVNLKCFRNQRGTAFIEWLFILPMIIMIVSFGIEMGFAMYDFSTINYAASSTALEAARKGEFDDEIAVRTAEYINNWTSSGKDLGIIRSDSPFVDPKQVVVWGPSSGSKFQRGQMITVGILYPIEFKMFYMDALAHWVIDDQKLALKARASALSEVYFEP